MDQACPTPSTNGDKLPEIIRPSKDALAKFAISVLPMYAEVLKDIQDSGGRIIFPERIIQLRDNLKISEYVYVYGSEQMMQGAFFKVLLLIEENAPGALGLSEMKQFAEEKPQEFLDELVELTIDTESDKAIDDSLDEIFSIDPVQAKAEFDARSPEDQKKGVEFVQWCGIFFFATLHNYLSLMVHGKRMTTLVPAAIQGDHESFLKAIQIDRSLLSNHPHFRAALQKASEQGDKEFLKKIAYRTQNPTVRGRIKHPSLWLLFSILESLNSLDGVFTHSELLDLCDEAGIARFENQIEDVGYLSKRLMNYRRYQKTGGVSTH